VLDPGEWGTVVRCTLELLSVHVFPVLRYFLFAKEIVLAVYIFMLGADGCFHLVLGKESSGMLGNLCANR
jgi:uncharacterized YccA/Bax inhibitor family protein